MSSMPDDVSPPIDLTRRQMVGPVRTSHPQYVDLLPPCNDARPAGENIQGWLAQAQAGRFQKAWEVLIRDNPSPPFTVASATTLVKAAATATTSTAP
jgi:formate dehydrogenase (NADP+) beta subunit